LTTIETVVLGGEKTRPRLRVFEKKKKEKKEGGGWEIPRREHQNGDRRQER